MRQRCAGSIPVKTCSSKRPIVEAALTPDFEDGEGIE